MGAKEQEEQAVREFLQEQGKEDVWCECARALLAVLDVRPLSATLQGPYGRVVHQRDIISAMHRAIFGEGK